MMVFRITHALILTACIGLGLLVYFHHRHRTVNQFFLLLTATLGLWLTFMMLAFQSGSAEEAARFVRATNGAALFIPYIFDCLRLAIVRPERPLRSVIVHHPLWLIACVVMAAMCQTPFFLRSVQLPADPHAAVAVPLYGPGIVLYGAYFVTTLLTMAWLYFREVAKAPAIQKAELQYVMLSWATGTVVGVTFSIVIPVATRTPQAVQLLPVAALFILGIIAYGIATRRIMDVPYILQRLTAYTILTVYLVALYFVVWQLALKVLGALMAEPGTPAHLLAALAVAFSLAPANGRMQQLANRLFVNVRSLDLTDTVQKANRILSSIATRDDLLEQFANLVAHALGTDRVLILLRDAAGFTQRFPRVSPPLHVDDDNALVSTLKATAEPLVADALARFRSTPAEQQAGALMTALQMAIAVGIHPQAGLQGIILLGPRLTGRIYGATEQRVLQVLCNQLAVGLENAELYTRLQDSAIYNNILVDSLVSGVIAAGADQRITVYNREAQRIIRRPPAEVLNQPLHVLPGPLQQALRQTFEQGRGARDIETRLGLDDHEDIPIRLGTSFFHSHTGKVLGALLVFEDLTAIRKLENQVRRTDRLASIGTLSAGMAHEIKNPLVTLKTFTQLLPERYEDPDFRDTFSSLVGQEVKRIDSIVNQLLRFARPAKPSLMPTHIHEVVDNTLRLVHQQLKQKGVTLNKQYNVASDLIQGDADLLVQAFLNFFLNALDAMDGGGELTVSTALVEQESGQITFLGVPSTEPCLRLSIRDSGKGIRPEDISHVFDPFFTTKSSGTGLGLSVSHGIIHEHHGAIDLESEVGRGTTFHLLFPLLRSEAAV